jgi:hypothetical protein
MKKIILTVLIGLTSFCVKSQNRAILKNKKGSYLYYGQPHIEDNSMLIDEAFNQSHRSIQHIANLSFSKSAATYWYSQEIPLENEKHQLSFAVNYQSIRKHTATGYNHTENGFGDVTFCYRPLIFGKNRRLLMVPKFNVIIPSGNAQKGFGSGGWGGEFGVAVTKRIIPVLITNYNIGYSFVSHADYYADAQDGSPAVKSERDCTTKYLGVSAIWLVRPKFNLMMEYLITYGKTYSGGNWRMCNNATLNPGFRFALQIGKMQIVPGIGLPLNFSGNQLNNAGLLVYLSIEHDY